MRYALFFCLSVLLFGACGPNYEYEKSYEFEEGIWTYADSLNFNFDIEDTLGIYNLYLELEHSPDFQNQNLYTLIHTRFPQGEAIQEPLSLELINKNTGTWQGNCNSDRCQLSIPIQQGAYFNQAGAYNVMVEQYMREDSVAGVYKLSFQLEKTGESRE